jgi:outer membrane protein assembly factor BamB
MHDGGSIPLFPGRISSMALMIAKTVVDRTLIAALCVVMAGATARAETADWPNWLGPDRNGISGEKELTWPAGGPAIAWRAKIGTGFSSIAVSGNRVVAMGNQTGLETLWCFDADSGKLNWKHAYKADLVDNLHEGGPCATPTIHDGKIYAVGKEGAFNCLQLADGKIVWQVDLRKELGVKVPEWGFTSSPVILGDKVILQAGPTVCLEQSTGKAIWKSTSEKPAYGTPTIFQHNGKTLLAVLNTTHLLVLDAADGKELAGVTWKTSFDTNAATPIVVGDKIWLSTGYDKGCALYEFTGDQLNPIYKNKAMRNHMNGSVLLDGHLYGFDGNSHRSELVDLVCLEMAGGTARWRQNGLGCGSLLIAAGKLLILSDEGTLVLAEAQTAGYKELGKIRVLEGRCWTMPTLAHGRVYCRNADGDLVCLDMKSKN